MSCRSFRLLSAFTVAVSTAALLVICVRRDEVRAGEAVPAATKDPAVERTRRHVKMLDDLYKTTIVYITNNYVKSDGDVAAGEIARDVFGAMRDKGWHDARLVDATGEPLNDENVPKAEFEKAAIKKILAGETYVDEVTTEKGKQYLLAATVVPVVNETCIKCHPGRKVGEVIGAVSYKVPVE